MKLIQKIGSKPESVNSTKTKQWGLFECPVCKEHVEKPLSRGRTNKSCGKQECRKAVFVPGINVSNKASSKPAKVNNTVKSARYKLRFYGAFKAWYGRLDSIHKINGLSTLDIAIDLFYSEYEAAKLHYPNQYVTMALKDTAKGISKENAYFTIKAKSSGLTEVESQVKQLCKVTGAKRELVGNMYNSINDGGVLSESQVEKLAMELIYLKYSHGKQTEYLYLISSGEHIKIGVAKDPKDRLAAISTGCPITPILVGTRQFGVLCYLVERALHIKYAEKRGNGEWFKLLEEDVDYILKTEQEELVHMSAKLVNENKSNYIETTRVHNDDKKLNKLRAEAEQRYIKACENYEKQKAVARKANEKPVIETVHEWDERFAHDRTNQIQATTTHGMSHTELYKAWQTVKRLYGVDDKWSKFEQFAEDIGEEFANLEQLAENARELPRAYPINSAKPVSSNNCEIKRVKDHKVKSAVARKVGQYNTEGDKIAVYETCRAAAEEVGCQASKISAVCRGTRKTSGGYIWRYEE